MGNECRDSSDRVVSIPSKYKTAAAMSNSEKKGFSSQAKRFTTHRPAEIPGPGRYFSRSEVNCPSFSTRGTSGFVPSKEAPTELSHPQRHVPGPNVYNLGRSLINKHDFNTGVSRVFRTPVAVKSDKPQNRNPAPNQYNIQNGGSRRFGASGSSAFISRTKREPYLVLTDLPSPCQYHVDDDFQRVSKTVLSPFRSKTQRLTGPKDNHVPGPGAYSPHRTPAAVRRPSLRRRNVLTISAPPLLKPKPPPPPGPGHYHLTTGAAFKQPGPTAAFASKCERITRPRRTDDPGPGFYDPYVRSKESFFYSDSRIWLPV